MLATAGSGNKTGNRANAAECRIPTATKKYHYHKLFTVTYKQWNTTFMVPNNNISAIRKIYNRCIVKHYTVL